MDYRSIVKEIEQGKLMPVYVCYGPEVFRRREFIRFMLGKLVEPEHEEFAVTRYDLNETPLDVVLDDSETVPFLVPKKVIIAENAQFLTGAKENSKVEHRLERLIEYLKNPVDYTVLILVVDAEKLDERKKLVKALKERKCLLAFQTLTAEELADWAARRANRLGMTFGSGALEKFLLYGGTDLQSLAMELDKLSLYVGSGGEVTADLVEQMVARTTEQNVFILIDELVKMNTGKALEILQDLYKQKEEPIKIVALMARQYRLIAQVKELVQTGYSHQQIAGAVGAHPYAVKLAAEQARKYDVNRLNRILSRLADLDYQMKSGQIDKSFGLELLLLNMAV
ncbi:MULTISPECIES: DNA polymerase III subunit delta [Paenibacillus]|uniref:DNA polymerase III subunit delta n=1 Tax=Paenibacillus residui TaxID=629724 RepID=A0ABW3DDH3_9BACL|nr:DNA polymerase III subunit delta [Aneurinibacillus sp. XH2]